MAYASRRLAVGGGGRDVTRIVVQAQGAIILTETSGQWIGRGGLTAPLAAQAYQGPFLALPAPSAEVGVVEAMTPQDGAHVPGLGASGSGAAWPPSGRRSTMDAPPRRGGDPLRSPPLRSGTSMVGWNGCFVARAS